jgi:hypothetical protein
LVDPGTAYAHKSKYFHLLKNLCASMPFTLRKSYLLLTVLLFITEVLIALYVHDSFIRPYFGDFLVVILLYCFVRAFFIIPVSTACIAVLLFAYLIEVSQYFHLSSLPLFHNSRLARVVLGSSFEWPDIALYTAGVAFVYLTEKALQKRRA